MKAIVQQRYGSYEGLELREVPEPEVGAGEVRVRVHAASLHPDVWHAVTGRPRVFRLMGSGLFRPTFPIPGTDMAGVVESVGPGITRFEPGDEVFGETRVPEIWSNGGAFAELVSAPEECLEAKPANVTFEQAASVPTSGLITLQNLPKPSALDGREMLINGAGGGVGTLALQIAKAYGARVTAVDTTGKLDLLRFLGADRVVDYTREDVRQSGKRYDFIFDVPANRRYSTWRKLLTERGRYVPIGHQGFGEHGGSVFGLIPYFLAFMLRARFDRHLGSGLEAVPDKRESLLQLREMLESGAITPPIDSVFSLDKIHPAFRRLTEGELLGKVILRP